MEKRCWCLQTIPWGLIRRQRDFQHADGTTSTALGMGSLRWPELQLTCGKEYPYTTQLVLWRVNIQAPIMVLAIFQHLGLSVWGLLLRLLPTGTGPLCVWSAE